MRTITLASAPRRRGRRRLRFRVGATGGGRSSAIDPARSGPGGAPAGGGGAALDGRSSVGPVDAVVGVRVGSAPVPRWPGSHADLVVTPTVSWSSSWKGVLGAG